MKIIINSYKLLFLLFATTLVISCGNQNNEIKVTKSTTISELPPVGIWVSDNEKIVITKNIFSGCKWLEKPPEGWENSDDGVCIASLDRSESKEEVIKMINNYYESRIKVALESNEPQDREKLISKYKNQLLDIQNKLLKMKQGSLSVLKTSTPPGDYDCFISYYFDDIHLFSQEDCRISDGEISITMYNKLTD